MKRALIIALAALGFVAWALAIAFELPIVSWFVYALWGSIGVGIIVRAFRRPRDAASAPVEAADQVQNIYLGRKPPTMYPIDPAASSQYGDAPPPDPLDIRDRWARAASRSSPRQTGIHG
jgi:hypothetical protein